MAFGWLSEPPGVKTSCAKNFLEVNRSLALTVTLQLDWLIEQCLLHIRVFFGGKTRSPCFDLFIHWLIKQIRITYRSFQGHTKIAYIAEKKASCTNFDGTYDLILTGGKLRLPSLIGSNCFPYQWRKTPLDQTLSYST